MGNRFLIDSNILIKFQAKLLNEKAHVFVSDILDNDFNISVISELEVLGHSSVSKEVEEFINMANIIEIDKSIRFATIQLRKVIRIKLPDAIIAATALVNNLTLVTENEKDFEKVEELKFINPFCL